MTIEFGLLGETLAHSFSPQLHHALADYRYELLPTPRHELETLFRRRDFRGLNVTIPYKQAVIPLCDEIDSRAAAIGAVNTVVNRNGRLIGYNTDLDGLITMTQRSGVVLAGKKVLILGSGGTSRTAHAAAQELGAAEIVVISRRGEHTYRTISRHADADVIINTTPVGMFPDCGASPLSLDSFPHLSGLLDVIYNPLRTALFLDAERRGIPCSCGLPMLAAQAWRAAELFTGHAIPATRMEQALSELTAQRTNIILIGMPGCGKTTIGTQLAQRLGRDFWDTDTVIEQTAGKTIPAIFAEDGEDAFRRQESACIRMVAAQTGGVIATGGGCVTRSENYEPLHQNGVLLHLTRSLDRLPTDNRPLSQQIDRTVLWQQRRERYAQFADATVDNNGTIEETLSRIIQEVTRI